MKKRILDVIVMCFALILVGCGSRRVETEKQEIKFDQKATEHKQRESERVFFNVVRDTVYIEIQSEVKTEIKHEKQTQTTQKKREYYESGVLKSEEEKSVTETEQFLQLKAELQKEINKSAILKKENESLLSKEVIYQQTISKLQGKEKVKNTDRKESFWLYVLVGVLGFLGGFAFDRLVLK